MGQWLSFCQRLTVSLESVRELFGTEAARRELSVGAGGDVTYHIDVFAEDILLRAFETWHRHTGEGLTVLSEEAGEIVHGDGGTLVIVDPIDGSANAKRGLPLYATTFAVARGTAMDDLLCGYTINHATGEVFFAERAAKNAPINTLYNWRPHRLPADLPPDQLDMLGMEMPDHFEELARYAGLLGAFQRTRLIGAMALDLAYIATGGLDAFCHPKPSRCIDFAGAALFLQGAGGIVCAPDGSPLEVDLSTLDRGPRVVACRTEAIRDRVVALLG